MRTLPCLDLGDDLAPVPGAGLLQQPVSLIVPRIDIGPCRDQCERDIFAGGCQQGCLVRYIARLQLGAGLDENRDQALGVDKMQGSISCLIWKVRVCSSRNEHRDHLQPGFPIFV
jgi:hypothetical protein